MSLHSFESGGKNGQRLTTLQYHQSLIIVVFILKYIKKHGLNLEEWQLN